MATTVHARPDTRLLGNSDEAHREAHDLQNENANCQVLEIIDAGNAVTSTPILSCRLTLRGTTPAIGASADPAGNPRGSGRCTQLGR